MNETIETVTTSLGKLYGLPGYGLVALFCVMAGFCLRAIKRFPNEGIPLALVLLGMVLNSVIADPASDNLPFRIWLVKNVLVGGICGYVAFLGMKFVARKLKLAGADVDAGDGLGPPEKPN